MPQYFCFVPGCRTGHGRKKKGERSLSLFKAPNATIFEEWKKVIPKRGREMRIEDRVCELHFSRKDIICYYEHRLKDGSVFRLERGIRCLAKDAIPSFFSDLPNTAFNKRKYIGSDTGYEDSTLSPSQEESSDSGILPIVMNISTKEERMDLSSFHENSCLQFSSPRTVNINTELRYSPIEALHIELFTFTYVTENLHLIEMPSPAWGLSLITEYDAKYIMCAKWKAFQPERKVVIDDNLNVKVFLKDKELVPIDPNKITSFNDVINLLKKVNSYVLCMNIDDSEMSDCELYIKSSIGRRKWCEKCAIWKKKISDSMRQRAVYQKKKRTLQNQKLICTNRVFPHVQQKVFILRKDQQVSKQLHANETLEAT